MSTLASAPIGVPPVGLWSRVKDWFNKPMEATSGDLEQRVVALQQEVRVLRTQLSELQLRQSRWGAPLAVLPTDVFIAGRRYSATGEAYWTTSNGPTDKWIAGARVSAEGDQVMVVTP